jgi:exonuclease SbcC
MRFHHLTVENITSLAGIHKIDFDDVLSEEDLFAITGPTGSGKSSILTALSLALYGKGHKSSLSAADYVTVGCREGRVELEFSTKGKRFLAKWSCTVLKKDGTPLKVPQSKPEAFIDEVAISLEEMRDAIGLTQEHFERTVILNQGEFSRFLTSTFAKRREILEHLAGTENLSLIKEILTQDIKELTNKTEHTSNLIEQATPFSADEIEILQSRLPLDQDKQTKLTNSLQLLSKQKKGVDELLALDLKMLDFKKRKDTANINLGQATQLANEEKRLLGEESSQYEKSRQEMRERSPVLKEAMTKQARLLSLGQEKKLLLERAQNFQKRSEQAQEKLLSLAQKKQLHTEALIALDPNYQDINFNILPALKDWASRNRQHKDQYLPLKSGHQGQNEQAQQLKARGEQERQLLLSIESEQLLNQEKICQFIPSLKEQGDQLISTAKKWIIQQQTKIDQKINEQKQNVSAQEKTKILFENTVNKKTQLATELEQQRNEQTILLNLQTELVKAQQARALDQARALCAEHSINQGQCVVCGGSIETLKPVLARDLLEQNLKAQSDLDEKISHCSTQVIQLQTQLDSIELDLKKHELELEQLGLDKIKTDHEILDAKNQQEIIHSQISPLIIKIEELAHNKRHQERLLTNLREEYQSLNSKLKESAEKIASLQKQEQELMTSAQEIIPELDLNNADRSIQEKIDLLSKAREHSQGISYAEKEEELIKSQQIEDQRSFEIDKNRLSHIDNEQKETDSFFLGLNIQGDPKVLLQELEQQVDAFEKRVKTRHDLLREKERARDQIASTIQSLDEGLKDLHLRILDETRKLKNGAIETASSLKLLPQFSDIFVSGLIEKTIRAEEKILAFGDDSNILTSLGELSAYRNDVQAAAVDELEREKRELDHFIIESQTKIREFEKKFREKEELRKKLSIDQARLDRLLQLAEAVGKNNDLRDFALGLIERALIAETNRELSTLCDGRYTLAHQASELTRADFYVIDTWNGGEMRKVSTLSGGETFLVSLAMALGLSEMTRGQLQVDCFFIDEGFGTLDTDSIDEVLEVLLNVRNRGKQIGIISHVKELTDRIAINLRLSKSRMGHSQIKLIRN